MNTDLETRVRSLERTVRALTLLLMAAASVLTLGAFTPQEDGTLRGRRIELVDADGKVRAELAVDADGAAGLFVRDAKGGLRATLTHDAEQSALFLYDGEGDVRVGAAQFAHGGGGFALHGPEGRGTAVLYLKGKGSLSFLDEEGGVIERIPK